MSRRPLCGLVLVAVAAVLAGCGSSDDTATTTAPRVVPDRPPGPAELRTITSTPEAPIYWLGPSYRDRNLTHAKLTADDPPDAIFQYGTPACQAGTGCSYPLGVATVRERDPASEEACWRDLGDALVLACSGSESLQIYTAGVEVFLQSADGDPLRAARALRLKTAAGGTAVAALPAPRPFSCDLVKRFPDAFAAALPAVLRPQC
jgi:hypothetical protein